MNIDELRQRARAAVNAARFESSLPSGECDDVTLRRYLNRRREEIIAAARGALNDHALVLDPEVILRLLYGEVAEEEFAILAAA